MIHFQFSPKPKSEADVHEPTPTETPQSRPVLDEVVADLKARSETGRIKYGTLLKTHNGRNALMDAYQEALDLAMYLKQRLMEMEDEA